VFYKIPTNLCKETNTTPDITTFVPQTKFEYCLNKEFDYCHTFGIGRYPKMELYSGITYLTETK
jgi:hypothetical protein